MPVLNEKEQEALLKELDERVEAELAADNAKKPIKLDEIDMTRADIAMGVATPDEIASMHETMGELQKELDAVRNAVYDNRPTVDEAKKIQDLSDRIDALDSALSKYDPNY